MCFTPAQALLAAKAGATFISPFVGRLDDIGQDGMQLISDIVEIYRNYPTTLRTEVLVASVRGPNHVIEAARLGAHVVDPAAQGAARPRPASADRQGPGRLPQGLGADRPADPVTGAAMRASQPLLCWPPLLACRRRDGDRAAVGALLVRLAPPRCRRVRSR